jgi:hypothetical protein
MTWPDAYSGMPKSQQRGVQNKGPEAETTTIGLNCMRDAHRFPDRPPGVLYRQAVAFRLIELGARASLVCQLTLLPRTTIKAWYQQIHGRSSPPGLSPFSDTWYVRTERHKLHTNIVWRLEQNTRQPGGNRATHLICVYEAYLCTTTRPLLNITRTHFVSRLLAIGAWRTAECCGCAAVYIGPVTELQHLCPACQLDRVRRCACGAALKQKGIGRRIRTCDRCGNSTIRDNPDSWQMGQREPPAGFSPNEG